MNFIMEIRALLCHKYEKKSSNTVDTSHAISIVIGYQSYGREKTNSVIFIGFYFANVPLYGWLLLCFWGLRLPSAVGLF